MSLMDKFLDGVKLVDDDEFEEEDYYDDEDFEEEEKKKGFFNFGKNKSTSSSENNNNLTPINGGKSRKKMQVCVIKPTEFDDVKEISDTLLSGCTIILNMEGIDLSVSQRIIDFMMGSCYAIDGNLQRISNYIFIITPAAVGISGDLQGLVDAFENAQMASGGGFASF